MRKKITNVLVEIDGKNVPIRDLPREDYEGFLEDMNKLRMAYISVVSRPKKD
jgi:UDP-3-O-acyl-N-acetylglucosamine deacetylase